MLSIIQPKVIAYFAIQTGIYYLITQNNNLNGETLYFRAKE